MPQHIQRHAHPQSATARPAVSRKGLKPTALQLKAIANWAPHPILQKRELADLEEEHLQMKAAPAENLTGMPNQLKSGIEHLSGFDMSDVRVHYNSDRPAQLQAHAYAQGNQIHLGPGQEQHLPHEAWHVVQQKQGRVRPTMQLQGLGVNDDMGLENEADVMGKQAMQFRG